MKKSLGPCWNQPFLILLIIISCSSICNTAPLHETTDLEQYPGTCYYNYNHYNEGDKILTNEPCLNCTCHNKMLMCYLRVCPFTKPIGHDCIVEKREDQCCPIITCPDVPVLIDHKTSDSKNELGFSAKFGCSIDSKFYPEGAQVPSNPHKPCELCYCIKNRTSCLMQECTLHVDGCQPIYNRGVCCPVRYDCEHDSIGGPYLEDSHTTVRPTEGFILTTVPSMKESTSCLYNELVFLDGALIPDTKACEHCYCMKGDIVCAVQECDMPLENAGKNCTFLPPSVDECCPKAYICQDEEDIEQNILDDKKDISPQGDNLLPTTVLPDDSDSDTGNLHQNLHETVSEEDVQLQEHIDDIPKTSTSKTTEVETSLDGTTTVSPSSNIKFAPESDITGLETTTQFEAPAEDDETDVSDLPSRLDASQDTTVDSTTELVNKMEEAENAGDKLSPEIVGATNETTNELETITTTDSPQSVNILPNEIIPIAIPGEGDCLYDNVTYKNNSAVPEITACDVHCICLSSIIKCKKVECAAPAGSHCTPIENGNTDACCSTYKCDEEQEMPVEKETPAPGKIEENLTTTISSLGVEENTSPTSSYSGVASNKKDEGLSSVQENQVAGELNPEPELPEPTPTEITSFNLVDGENEDNSQHIEDHTEQESGHKEEHPGDMTVEDHTDGANVEDHTESSHIKDNVDELQQQLPVIEKEEEVLTEKPIGHDHKAGEEHKEESEKESTGDNNKKDSTSEIAIIEDHTEQTEKDHKEDTNETVPTEDHTEAVHKTDVASELVTHVPGDETQIAVTTEASDSIVDKDHIEEEKPSIDLDSADKESHVPTDQPNIEVTTELVQKLESEDKVQLLENDNKVPEIDDTTDSVTHKDESNLSQHTEQAVPPQHPAEAQPQAEDTTEVINEQENEADLLNESNKDIVEPEAHTVGTIDLDRKHIDAQELPDSTESSMIIPLESESHVTTISPAQDVKGAPVIDEQDLHTDKIDQENAVQLPIEDTDQEQLKPGAIIEDNITEQALSEHSTDSDNLSFTTESNLIIKDDSITPELENADNVKLHPAIEELEVTSPQPAIEEQEVTSPQPDAEKEFTTEGLMSALQNILKATEISSTEEPEKVNESASNAGQNVEGNIEEPVQAHDVETAGGHIEETEPSDVKKPVGAEEVDAPESSHVENPIDGQVVEPIVGHDKTPLDDHDKVPVDGLVGEHVDDHDEKPVDEHVEDHTDGHVQQTTSDHVEDSVQSHVTEPADSNAGEQVADKTEPSVLKLDGIDYTTETPIDKEKIDHPQLEEDISQKPIDESQHVVPDDINIQDPNEDKEHIFNMIIDNLEEKTTIQPALTEEIIKAETSGAENTPAIELSTVPSIATNENLPSEVVVTERVDILSANEKLPSEIDVTERVETLPGNENLPNEVDVTERVDILPTKHTELSGIIEHSIKDEEPVTPTDEKELEQKNKDHKTPLIHEAYPTHPNIGEIHDEKIESGVVTPDSSLPEHDKEDKLETTTDNDVIRQDQVIDSNVQTPASPGQEHPTDKDQKTTLKTPESPEQEVGAAHDISDSGVNTTELPVHEEDQPESVTQSHILNTPEENISDDSVVSQTEQNITPVDKEEQLPESATTSSAAPEDTGIEGQLPESNSVASAVDGAIKEQLPEINTAKTPVDETNKEQLAESNTAAPTVDEAIKEQLAEDNTVTSTTEETIKEQLPEINTAAAAAEEDIQEQLLESSTSPSVQPAAEETPKPELNAVSHNEVAESSSDAEEGSGDSTTQQPISNQISTEDAVPEKEHPEIHTAIDDVKPEHGSLAQSTKFQPESELSSTIKTDVEEHLTESSLQVEEVTPKEKVPSIPIDSVSQTTTELYESLNKTEEDKISEIVTPEQHEESSTAHSTVHATPETHNLPASEEAIDIEDDLSSHSTSSHPASSLGMGDLDTQTEPSLGPLPGGHYSSFNEDEYAEEEDPGAFGPGTCRYGGKLFVSAQQIPRDDPCDFCFCFRSDIICLQQSCPPPISGCHEEPISGFCCPRYECPVSMGGVLNLTTTTTTTTTLPPHFMHRPSELVKRTGCYIGGQTFKVGEAIDSASGPCIQCSCGGDGQMKCEPKVCTPEPMLRQMIAVVASRRR